MNKDDHKLLQRAKYVQAEVNSAKYPSEKISELAENLFLSEKTIQRDLEREIPDTTDKTDFER